MNTSTIRASFKFISLTALALLLAGCMQPKNIYEPAPLSEMSQMQWRSLQTREFESKSEIGLHKAIVTTFQDEGFIVTSYNKEIGLITGAVEYNQLDEATRKWRTSNLQNGWQTVRKVEASASVSMVKDNLYRVRVNLVQKGVSDTGGVLWSQPVSEAQVYSNLFSKIEKSVFLQKEKL